MALYRRFFYRKPPEGLLEISDRVYVFDCCFSTNVLNGDEYKEYVGDVTEQLQHYFPDASFMVFNFRERDQRSQILMDTLFQYDMKIMEYPRRYEKCPLLPLEMIHHFLRCSESCLSSEGQQNILLMHCEKGGWPVLAFMLAGLLLYTGQYTGEQRTLEMLYQQAPKELLQISSAFNPQPSQLRYLQYISGRNFGSDWPPFDTPLVLDRLILRNLPLFDGGKGCRPVVHVYGHDPETKSSRFTTKQLFSSLTTKKQVRHYSEEECILIKLDIPCRVQGDVVVECVHLCDDLIQKETMFRVMFHTSFIQSNILVLNRDDIDVLWDARDQFSEDFRAEILFSDVREVPANMPVEEGDDIESENAVESSWAQSTTPPPPPPPPPPSPTTRSPPHLTASAILSGISGTPSPPLLSPPMSPPPPPPPPRTKGSECPSLKPLYWSKITRAIQGSLWDELQRQPAGTYQTALEFDESELERLFSARAPKPARAPWKSADKNKATGLKSELVTLAAMLVLDDSVLDADEVENLMKLSPTKEEMELPKVSLSIDNNNTEDDLKLPTDDALVKQSRKGEGKDLIVSVMSAMHGKRKD